MQPKLDQNKKIDILTLYPEYDGTVKKTISQYYPFNVNELLSSSYLILQTETYT
jgi:hypothetical protein